jgi:glycosyltransferase involved in cell wall biosynthesis
MTATVVAVWNELTPYRLHVMRRVLREVEDLKVINVFTHSVENNSMPWKMEVDPDLCVMFRADLAIPYPECYVHRNTFRLASWIKQIVAAARPTFVLMHGHNDATRLLLIRHLRKHSIPTLHASDANLFDETAPSSLKAWARQRYLRHVLRQFTGYLPMGTAGFAYYRYLGVPNLPRFPFPYEPDYAQFSKARPEELLAFKARHGLSDSPKFLCCSRLIPIKNVDIVIRAFGRLHARRPDWELMIAGVGPMEQSLRKLAHEVSPEHIKFLGFLQLEELRVAYSSASVLVHASEREPWGLVINEAVASGLAVVSTEVTGAAVDLVRPGFNGYMVPAGSIDALEDAMDRTSDPKMLPSLQAHSKLALASWRLASDPVDGLRKAVRHFAAHQAGKDAVR